MGAAAQADTGQSCEVSDCGIIHKTGCHISCATGHAPHCSCDCIDRWLGICVKKDDRCYCE